MYSLVKYILFISFSIILFSCSTNRYGVRQKYKPPTKCIGENRYSRFNERHYNFKR